MTVPFVPVSFSKIPSTIENLLKSIGYDQVIIGFSGGIDSTVLLHACASLDLPITAVHINHKVNLKADEWQQHCQHIATTLRCDFQTFTLEQCPQGESFEAWASKARMQHFQSVMSQYQNPVLLLGHHCNDQAETFLLQAIRGTGLSGLASMPKVKPLAHGQVLRPLLDFTRIELEQYIAHHQLRWVEDDSNQDTAYLRNQIRHKVMPNLPSSANKTLARTAMICAETQDAMHYFLNQALSNAQLNPLQLSRQALQRLPRTVLSLLLPYWLKKHNLHINHAQNQQLQHMVYDGENGAELALETHKIVVNRTMLYLHSQTIQSTTNMVITWLKQHSLIVLDWQAIKVTERQSSDRCRYPHRHKKNKLKVLFQELEIDQVQRQQAKVVRYHDDIVAIYPFFVCPEFLSDNNTSKT